MVKQYHFNDPRTAEELAGIFWTAAKRWGELGTFLQGLLRNCPDLRPIYPDDFEGQVKEVFEVLDFERQQWLSEGSVFPGIARSSGDPSSNLHILAQNPTFSTCPDHDMLHAACPTMGLVVECGFTRDIAFATDFFPLRITFDVIYSDPFDVFPQYENLFLAERLPHILGGTGVVLLLFGVTAYKKADALRNRSFLNWDEQMAFERLNIYLETYKDGDVRKRIRKVIISAPHPSNFQEKRMREAIMNGDIVDVLKLAREMDECCNLAAELIGHSLKYSKFWIDRVLNIYENMGGKVGFVRDNKGFTIFL